MITILEIFLIYGNLASNKTQKKNASQFQQTVLWVFMKNKKM